MLTWQHRITRAVARHRDLFGRVGWRWRLVIRTSNAYVFRDPQPQLADLTSSKSETQNQVILGSVQAPARRSHSPLERALARSGAVIAARAGIEQKNGGHTT